MHVFSSNFAGDCVLQNVMERINMKKFFRSQPVLVISFLAAVLTVFVIPPDKEYIGYINKTVLIELFSLMTAVGGLRSVGIFDNATSYLLKKAGTLRRLGLIFIVLCYFSAMLVTNDVALLTFVPLTLLVYSGIKDEKSRIITIVLETSAANAGSMLTPIGNPQNLFVYDTYKMTALSFLKAMLPAGIISLIMICLLTLLIPDTPCDSGSAKNKEIPKVPTAGYCVLFVICLLTVLRVIPDVACFAAAVVIALIFDRKLLAKVDYALLATFVCFFVFVGNIGRIDAVRDFFSSILSGRELLVTALLSQVISNVPAAVMLSGFTENGTQLLLGADLGGFGTLIASLASLISFQIYRKAECAQSGRYILIFSLINFGMLIPLLILHMTIL